LSLMGYAGVAEPVLTVNNAAETALFATRADDNSFTRKNSKSEVDAHPGHAYCRTSDGEMYMKTILPSTSAMRISLGDIDTGVNDIEFDVNNISIEYVAGTINYSVAAEYDNAFIEFITPDGRVIARESDIKADGYVHAIEVPDFNGFCIARLKASSSKGSADKSVKYMR
ncbi:MAG: hypothetical protein K2L89_06370, partial [Muribaculaceae bacterium]|nr:hypothetical protein [Muribaculaceae bacterium]